MQLEADPITAQQEKPMTARKRRFVQCDVFTSQPTKGNALAVVVDADGMSAGAMRDFAAWTNLAETTFLLPPSDPMADYRVRIFTPVREMPFAGHPTLGSCAAWLHTGGVPREAGVVRQECGVGVVEIHTDGQVPAFVAPPTRIEALDADAIQAISRALSLDSETILGTAKLDNGPVWQVLELRSAADVLAVDSSTVKWPVFKSIGLIGRHEDGAECDYEVRMLAPSSGMSEDPITGSLNAAIAHWMLASGRLSEELVIAQGTCIHRLGRVYIRPEPASGRVFVGGESHVLIDGTVML
jgi:PhzF family phenazine biosynthesis protein